MTEADVTCVVCRSPDTVGPSKLYCGGCEPVGHRDERANPAVTRLHAHGVRCEALAHAEAFRSAMEQAVAKLGR